jgi:hypothetical protein
LTLTTGKKKKKSRRSAARLADKIAHLGQDLGKFWWLGGRAGQEE